MTVTTTVLSLGAGVQSTTIALLAIDGFIPKPEHAIFADTGWEPAAVYDHLDRLEVVLADAGITLHRVSAGNIRDDALAPGHRYASMPIYLKSAPTDKNKKGHGIGRRQCTNEYKLTPIKEKIRELLGGQVGTSATGRRTVGRVPAGKYAINYVGISADEAGRIKPSDVKYMRRIDPLVDLLPTPWTRAACVAYLSERWPDPVPRSACIGCPFHRNSEWRHMRDNAPAEWADAIDFDEAIRNGIHNERRAWRGELYLHDQRVPLRLADIDKPEPASSQASFFDDPRGCSPFGCQRSEHTDQPGINIAIAPALSP